MDELTGLLGFRDPALMELINCWRLCQGNKHSLLKRQEIESVGGDVEKRKPSYNVGGSVNWCSHYGKQYGDSSKILRLELPYDPAVPLIHISQGIHKH